MAQTSIRMLSLFALPMLLSALAGAGCSSGDTAPSTIPSNTTSPGDAGVVGTPPTNEDAGDGGIGTKADAAPESPLGTATVASNAFTSPPYTPKDSLVVINKRPSTSTPNTFVEELEIYIIDEAKLCGYLQRNERPANAHRIKIEIEKRGASTAAAEIAPGTYPLVTKGMVNPAVESSFESTTYLANADGTCSSADFIDLSGEKLTDIVKNELVLTSVGAAGVKGSFELRFADGKFVQGTFDSPTCDESGAPSGNTVCK